MTNGTNRVLDEFAKLVTDAAGARWWLMRRDQHWYIVGAF